MNYYQDNRNDFSRDYDYSRDNERSRDFDNKNSCNSKNGFNHDGKHSCCVRRVEETYLCFPSYYNEEKKEEKKECRQCWEGSFKICPKREHCEDKNDYNNYDKNNCYDNDKEDFKNNNICCCRQQSRCGFCGLFRRW